MRAIDGDAFGGEGRLEQLQALLAWPGPPAAKTRYLQIDPKNEYSDRRVLPAPLHVLNGPDVRQSGQASPGHARRPAGQEERRRQSQDPSRKPQRPEQKPDSPVRPRAAADSRQAPAVTTGGQKPTGAAHPAAGSPSGRAAAPPAAAPKPVLKLPEAGDTFTGTVERIEPDGTIIVKYKEFPLTRVRATIAPAQMLNKVYRPGNLARCEVIKKHERLGMWELECRPAPKKGKKG